MKFFEFERLRRQPSMNCLLSLTLLLLALLVSTGNSASPWTSGLRGSLRYLPLWVGDDWASLVFRDRVAIRATANVLKCVRLGIPAADLDDLLVVRHTDLLRFIICVQLIQVVVIWGPHWCRSWVEFELIRRCISGHESRWTGLQQAPRLPVRRLRIS